MTGRPDYDVGDLVVCVDDGPSRALPAMGEPSGLHLGRVYRVLEALPPDSVSRCGRYRFLNWAVYVSGAKPPLNIPYHAPRFRKLNPKPPEFFTGTIEANQREGVPA